MNLEELNDYDLLALLEERQSHLPISHHTPRTARLLYSTPQLECPPTYKCYRAHIAVGTMREHHSHTDWFLYVGYTTYGPANAPEQGINIHDWGSALDDLIVKLNKTLKAKQRKGYQQRSGAPVTITREEVRAAIEALIPTSAHG